MGALGHTQNLAAAKVFFQGSGGLYEETGGGTQLSASRLVLCKVPLEGMGWADLTAALLGAKGNTSPGNTDAFENAKSPSWLHAPLPQGRHCQS